MNKYIITALAAIVAITLSACGSEPIKTASVNPKVIATATATPSAKEKRLNLEREATGLMVEIGGEAGRYADDAEGGCEALSGLMTKFDHYSDLVDQLVKIDSSYDTETRDNYRESLDAVEIGCAQMDGIESASESAPDEESVPEEEPSMTTAQENAIESAEGYLDSGDFSKKGLIDQLKYEDFSKSDAKFAVSHVDADWKQEAADAAEGYLDSGSFSKQGLLEQLLYEEFTQAQAEYGVSQAY